MSAVLPDPAKHPTVSLEEAAKVLGISRWLAYRLVRENAFPIPVLRLGRVIKVLTRRLLDAVGAGEQRDEGPAPHETREPTPGANLRPIAGRGRGRAPA